MKEKKKSNAVFIIFAILTIILFAIVFKLSSSSGAYLEKIVISRKDNIAKLKQQEEKNIYSVFLDSKILKSFENLDDAIYYANMYDDSYIMEKGKTKLIWHNMPKYHVYVNNELAKKFHVITEAIEWAKQNENSYVCSYDKNDTIWSNTLEIKQSIILDVPFISQMPELLRGCEVTSLAMLLQYIGYDVSKLTLAEQIDKDLTPYEEIDGIKYFGDPSFGFLGSMTDADKAGYGANHIPIKKLLQRYTETAIDLTGIEFDDLYYFLNKEIPVWVITNTDLKKLDSNEFYTWLTPFGETITATNKEHSVLITGYDHEYIYINDPLYFQANKKIVKKEFTDAWKQMGNQAVTILEKEKDK